MTARNTTTTKEESKARGSRATKAKEGASKPASRRGRPRKVKPLVEEDGSPIDETGVKLYAPKPEDDDTPFSFESEVPSVSSGTGQSGENAFTAGSGQETSSESATAVFSSDSPFDAPSSNAATSGGFETSSGGEATSGGLESPAGSFASYEPSFDAVSAPFSPEPSSSSSSEVLSGSSAGAEDDGSALVFSRAFEPVSGLAEESSLHDASGQTSGTGSFGFLSTETDDDRRDVEFELAQERVDSTMATLVESQRTFFNTSQTRDVNFRILQLKKLYRAIRDNEGPLMEALGKDLSKSPCESYSSEIGLVLHEIQYVMRHLKSWARPRRKQGELHLFPGHFNIYTEPVGVSLVMSTWNYPVLLSLDPIVSSMAAGNTVILKTSEFASATNAVLKAMLEKTFNRSYLAVVEGGYTENHALLEQHFDFIFFTGSQNVGRIVMSSAARFLTPVCLELGGKSPCIVDSSANLEIAARRIVWGKFLNAGQTCVAPDYVLVDKGIKGRLIELMEEEIRRQFGDKPLENKDYPKIINERRFVHLSTLCPKAEMDFVTNKIAPTIMDLGDMNGREAGEAEVMQEEIFGPLLPVMGFDNLNSVMEYVSSRPVPLSLYVFSTSAGNIRRVTQELRFGGGCVNDVVLHLASSKAPFGGAGESGMGGYHGVYGFRTFSHEKSVLVQSPKMDIKIRYAPYTDKMLSLLKKVLR